MSLFDNVLGLWRAVYEVQPGIGALLAILAAYWIVTGLWNSVRRSRSAGPPVPPPSSEGAGPAQAADARDGSGSPR